MIRGGLFTDYFLTEGILQTTAWTRLDPDAAGRIHGDLTRILKGFGRRAKPGEDDTINDVIVPTLDLVGWKHWLAERALNLNRREDVPDLLLFPDADAKEKATRQAGALAYRHGACLVEAKRWQLELERPDAVGRSGVPATQMLRYLRRADELTEGKLRWGILTNGGRWRLYRQGDNAGDKAFFEVDVARLVDPGQGDLLESRPAGMTADDWQAHVLKLFALFFGRDAFVPDTGQTFHDVALHEGEQWKARVTGNLSRVVFDGPTMGTLATEIAGAAGLSGDRLTPAALEEVREGALILLYRLLFVFYAEDRNLLPDEVEPYASYSITRLRMELARDRKAERTHSRHGRGRWGQLVTVFRAIAHGDDDLGIPPYNGGLFSERAAPILARIELSDAVIAAVMLPLSHVSGADGLPTDYINYRDLSVQQLGSLYERLLEWRLTVEDGTLSVGLSPFARKGSGSYYTPEDLVSLVIERAVGPLVAEAREAFRARAEAAGRRPAAERAAELAAVDPASRILSLRILDPAMGSGHFLVSLVDWLTERVMEARDDAMRLAGADYVSPLDRRIEAVRARIEAEAARRRWPMPPGALEDANIVRRMVLKRCVYGVDLNPMAVELAKVALWLHSFTVGAPLSFLDHHLRCGNSLFGERVNTLSDWAFGGNLLVTDMVRDARNTARGMATIEDLVDAELSDVKNSEDLFREVVHRNADLVSFLDLVQGLRWAGGGDRVREAAIHRLKRGDFGNPVALLRGEASPPAVSPAQADLLARAAAGKALSKADKASLADAEARKVLPAVLEEARAAARRERFFHWEVAFPGVWTDWLSAEPKGGFDAVIGNPPWDRIKFQEVEWFAERRPEIARATRASDRKRLVTRLLAGNDPVVADYRDATARAEGSARVARESGAYPLLSAGDVNIYSLFVERGLSLLKPEGLAGLVTPSGIASDKSASAFFRSVSTTGRLGCLFDFENRRGDKPPFFPDVDSRFKFCILVVGGTRRAFTAADCGFFLRAASDTTDPDRTFRLSAADFLKVNPNTGTAPVFRSRRDAELVKGIYDRLPVLVDRSGPEPVMAWPVRYQRMFDMTNDSHLFVTRAELEKTAYPVGGGRWRRGSEEFVPLYVGKMISHYDHRAASVSVNEENLHVSAGSGETSEEQHRNPAYLPSPQFWVNAQEVLQYQFGLFTIAFRSISNPTNARTLVSAIVPESATGNSLSHIITDYSYSVQCIICSYIFDYLARQKLHGTNVNWYIVEQLPVPPPAAFDRRFGPKTAAEIVREEVLALTYTAHDMAPFARDMGHVDPGTGDVLPPFPWDPPDRLRRRAKLDALMFMLFFPSDTPDEIAALRETAAYVYATFPIVEREEVEAHGRYLSRDLCLLHLNALAAGDPDAMIRV
jgi:hypothetical protein